MPYIVVRSDGIPLGRFDKINVYRGGSFCTVFNPAVNDIITIDTKHQLTTYLVERVEGDFAYTTMKFMQDKI